MKAHYYLIIIIKELFIKGLDNVIKFINNEIKKILLY